MMCQHQVDTIWLVFEKHRVPKSSFFSVCDALGMCPKFVDAIDYG